MGARVDNYDGERVDVEEISVEELERIRAEIFAEIATRKNLTPTRMLLEEVDLIDEELEARAREQDRQETADDDARVGL